MQYDKQDTMLAAGFEVVRQYDPALYKRMSASSWFVTTDTSELAERVNMSNYMFSTQAAFGTTLEPYADGNGSEEFTFINPPSIADWARSNDVPVAYFTADVLAHEFVHTAQNAPESVEIEIPAFRAGTSFALKLPDPYGARVAAMSDATVREQPTALG